MNDMTVQHLGFRFSAEQHFLWWFYWQPLRKDARKMKEWRCTRGYWCWRLFSAIYESDHWTADVKHEKDKARPEEWVMWWWSRYREWMRIRPQPLRYDDTVLAEFFNWVATQSHKCHTFLENLGLQLICRKRKRWCDFRKRYCFSWSVGYATIVDPYSPVKQWTCGPQVAIICDPCAG